MRRLDKLGNNNDLRDKPSNHNDLRNQPRYSIPAPGTRGKDPALTGADPEDDCFVTGKSKGRSTSMLSSKSISRGYRPMNTINEPTGCAAWQEARPGRTIEGTTGTLGMARNDAVDSSTSDRLPSILGRPQRISTATTKPALQMQVDLSNDPEEIQWPTKSSYDGSNNRGSTSSPSFAAATGKFMKPDTKEMIMRSNSSAFKGLLNESDALGSFGMLSNTEAPPPPKKKTKTPERKKKEPSFFERFTGYLSGSKADSESECEIEIESGNDELDIDSVFSTHKPLRMTVQQEPLSPSKLPSFSIGAILWGDTHQLFGPPQNPKMEAKLSFPYDGSGLVIHLISDCRRHSFPIDANFRLRQIVAGPDDGPDLKFIDLYYVKPLEELADAGFKLDDPQYSTCTNVRFILQVGAHDERVFDTSCKKLLIRRYMRETPEDYQSMRPCSHYEKLAEQQMNLPFAVNRRPARNASTYTRSNVTRSSPWDPSMPKRKYRSSIGADDDVMIMQPSVPTRGQLMFIYPEDSLDGIHMTTIELARLNPGVYLNDNNIDFELSRMYHDILSPAQQERTFVYNCFFYKRLTSSSGGKESSLTAYERIKSWTGDVNIFDRDFLVVPINEALHWYLAVIINPGWLVHQQEARADEISNSQVNLFDPVDVESDGDGADRLDRTYIVILDSLFNNRTGTMTRLKNYLVSEARAKLGLDLDPTTIKGFLAKNIPKQDNTYDCGCFLLQYVQEIFSHHDSIRPELIDQRHTWFDASLAKSRRGRMIETMNQISAEYRVRHPDMHEAVDLGNSSDIEEITIDLC